MESNQFSIKPVSTAEMIFDIEKVFAKLEDKRIKYKSFKGDNLGTVVSSKSVSDKKVFIDTTIDDILSLDSNYKYRFLNICKDVPIIIEIRPAKKGDFRGEVNYLPPKTIHLVQSVFKNKKNIVSEELPILINSDFSARCLLSSLKNVYSEELRDSINNAIINTHIAICFAWDDYFSWKIRVKMPEWQKSVDFYIQPSNIKQVFKLRDIADGEQRRKALKHVVSAHSRKLSNGEKIEVMRYLRGKEKFTQNGYEMTIIPSKDDIATLGAKI